jgi:hypothetical protein
MSTPRSERLLKAREIAGFAGPVEAAEALGVNRYTYIQHENGTRGFRHDSAIQYAKKFKVSLDWLLSGKGQMKAGSPTIPVTQYIGAGAEVVPFPDQGSLDEEPVLVGLEGCEAARVRGDSMPPFKDGWLLIYRHPEAGVQERSIGKLCIVDVVEGPTLVKVLQRGSKRGLWNLVSWKGAVRTDVQINWAAPVLYIQPK